MFSKLFDFKKNIFLTFISYMSVFTELTSVSDGLNVSLFVSWTRSNTMMYLSIES